MANSLLCLTFFLDEKSNKNLSADRQEIKAENHFREIIFRLALHATQAMSQKCLLWRIWLTRGWLTQTHRTASSRDFLTKMILGRALTLASGSFSANKAEQRVRLASTNCANRNSDGLVAVALREKINKNMILNLCGW